MGSNRSEPDREPVGAEARQRRKATEISVDEYLYVAEQNESLKGMARNLGLNYSTMHRELHKRGIFEHVYNLLQDKPTKPGPRTKPPLPTIEGAGPNPEWDVEAIRESAKRRFAMKSGRAEEKANQHIRFPHGPVAIFFLGDQHIGNSGTDIDRMYREQRLILDTPGGYVFQMGDTVDNFIIGKLMAENMKPATPVWEQWVLADDYLARFKEKYLASCGGNHEAWTLRVSGIDFAKEITPAGVLYDADEIKVTFHVGQHQVRVRARHKWKNKSQYNQTHGQEWSARFESAEFDVYVGAHTHTGAVAREFTLNKARKLSIQTGSYKIHDDYARVIGFPEHDASTACALVINDTGSMWACADLLAVKEYMMAVYPQQAA